MERRESKKRDSDRRACQGLYASTRIARERIVVPFSVLRALRRFRPSPVVEPAWMGHARGTRLKSQSVSIWCLVGAPLRAGGEANQKVLRISAVCRAGRTNRPRRGRASRPARHWRATRADRLIYARLVRVPADPVDLRQSRSGDES